MTENRTQPATPLWQLRYTLAREDIAAFEFLPRELIGLEKLWVLGPILVLGAAAGYFQDRLGQIVPWDTETKLGQLASVLLAIAAGYLVSLVLLTVRTRRRIAAAQIPGNVITLRAFPDHYQVDDGRTQNSIPWTSVHVIETAEHCFLCPRRREAAIIPLRAFRDREDMSRFARFAETKAGELDDNSSTPDRQDSDSQDGTS